MHAVLCLGPKRGGQPYKPREETMLRILARALALRFAVIDPEEMEMVAVRHVAPAAGGNRVQAPASGPLSPCEEAVLVCHLDGLSNRQIAARVGRSPKTSGIHIAHVYKKLGAHSRAQAVHVAYQQCLLPTNADV